MTKRISHSLSDTGGVGTELVGPGLGFGVADGETVGRVRPTSSSTGVCVVLAIAVVGGVGVGSPRFGLAITTVDDGEGTWVAACVMSGADGVTTGAGDRLPATVAGEPVAARVGCEETIAVGDPPVTAIGACRLASVSPCLKE